MVRALEAAREVMDTGGTQPGADRNESAGFVFPYDAATLAELDAAADDSPHA
jgi:hypothetical protein